MKEQTNKLMLPNEFKARLIMIGMNQTSFAHAVGLSVRTINKYVNETTIPLIAELALEALENRYRQEQQ